PCSAHHCYLPSFPTRRSSDLLNPILYLAVFGLVFNYILRNHVPDFPVYLLSGLLAWNLFSTSLAMRSRSVVDNANLVKRVYIPRDRKSTRLNSSHRTISYAVF